MEELVSDPLPLIELDHCPRCMASPVSADHLCAPAVRCEGGCGRRWGAWALGAACPFCREGTTVEDLDQ